MSWIRNAAKVIFLFENCTVTKILYDFFRRQHAVHFFWPSKQRHCFRENMFSHSLHWSMFWIQKIPTQRTTLGLPNNSNFPLFICCGPEFRTELLPSSSSRRSCAECHTVCIRFIISWNSFPPIQTEYFPEQTRQVRRTYLPWLLSALFDFCLCGRRRVSSVQSSVGEAEG